MYSKVFPCVLAAVCLIALGTGPLAAQAIIADHNAVGQFEAIPDSVIEDITALYTFYYVHTSHGSQIMTGIDMVEDEDPLYASPYFYEVSDDLGGTGDISWVAPARTYLNNHPACNVAMFSWCGGVSGNTEEGINIYLNAMNQLEIEYPAVTFIYMTGHLDGSGPTGNLYIRNNQIRDYCLNNDKILFDFADIESYDPDGTWYPDETDACNWCYDWCSTHTCPSCGDCAHSHCFNCYRKGKAFWWMMAQVIGFEPNIVCGDANGDGIVNIGDAVFIINYIFKGGPAPVPLSNADANCDSEINVADGVYIVNYVFKSGPDPCCP